MLIDNVWELAWIGCLIAIRDTVDIQKNDLHFVLTFPGFCGQSIAPMPSAFILRIRSASSGVNPGLSDDAPRRFIRLGNPFLFSRVFQGGFELLAVQTSFEGDLLYGGVCSLVIGNEPRIDQSPHKLYRSFPLHAESPPVKVT